VGQGKLDLTDKAVRLPAAVGVCLALSVWTHGQVHTSLDGVPVDMAPPT